MPKVVLRVEYIETGRFKKPTIWVKGLNSASLIDYRDDTALSIGRALELWKSLTKSLIEAGQGDEMTYEYDTKEADDSP